MPKRTNIKAPVTTEDTVSAAEQKQLLAERKHLVKTRHTVAKDFKAERHRLEREVIRATSKLIAFDARRRKRETAELDRIDRRIGIIDGRLGF